MEKINRKIKIKFVDFWPGFDEEHNCFTNMLIRIYGKSCVEIVDKNPEYLFFSCFGFEYLKYNCIKIFFTGENIVPDFNLCDYAMGVHEITFDDRYMCLPLFFMYDEAYDKALHKGEFADEYYLNRKFCCFVISNAMGDSCRRKMISLLNEYNTVDSGGAYLNNIGGRCKNKLEFVSGYKFQLCFENSMANGYTTEKILEGFAGNSVPIYWGNPNVSCYFNKKAFIDCNDFSSLEEAMEFVKKVDANDDLYLQMVKEPVFNDDSVGKKEIIQTKLYSFLRNIFDEEIGKAGRINKICIGKRYIERMRFFRWGFKLHYLTGRIQGSITNYFLH